MLLMCALARKTVCCSSLAGFFVFTHHHEVAGYPLPPCERSLGASRFHQRRHSLVQITRLIRFVRLVVAGCHWPHLAALCGVWCTRPACFSWTSQQSVSDGPEFVGRRSQSIFSINAKVSWSKWFGAEAASSHRWLRRGKGLLSEAPGLGKDLCCASSRSPFGPQPRAEDQCPGKRTLPRSDVLGLSCGLGEPCSGTGGPEHSRTHRVRRSSRVERAEGAEWSDGSRKGRQRSPHSPPASHHAHQVVKLGSKCRHGRHAATPHKWTMELLGLGERRDSGLVRGRS